MQISARSHRRLTALAATITVGFASFASPAGAASSFGDVADGAFFTEPVAWMVSEGITTGLEAGCFGPDEPVSRGQVAAFLFRVDRSLGNSPTASHHPFADVVATYQQKPVAWLFVEGITTGTSASTFEPDTSISRGDFAVMLWRYAGRPIRPQAHQFTDVTRGYQRAAISWMSAAGITTGTTSTTFSPDDQMTRAQAATFIWRFVDPAELSPTMEERGCARPLRAALVAGGLTSDEAACTAPFLIDFEIHTLVAVVTGQATAHLDLVAAVGELLGAGCISDIRIPELTRLFL